MSKKRWRGRSMLVAGVVLLASGVVGLVGTLTAHADQSGTSNFGGYSITATAPGFEATEDEPSAQAHPEGQGAVPETSSLLSSGSVGYALSSLAWPGATFANGGQLVQLLFPGPAGQVVPVPDAVTGLVKGEASLVNYPIRAEARTGSQPNGTYNQVPAVDLSAHADTSRVEGIAQVKGADQPGGATYGTMRSNSASTLTDNTAKAVASSTVNNVSMAGGAVKIGSVISTAEASSDGKKSTSSGSTVVTDMTVAGQRAYFDQTGLHAGSAGQPVNAAADQALNQALAGFGMKVYTASPQSQSGGATASYTAGSLVFNWTPPNNPSQNVFIVTLGGARVSVNTTQAFDAGSATATAGSDTGSGAAAPVGGDTTGATPSDLGGASSIPGSSPQTGNSAAPGANQGQPGGAVGTSPVAFFGGIGSAWIVLTVVGATLAGFGAKRLSDEILARRTATTCPLDH